MKNEDKTLIVNKKQMCGLTITKHTYDCKKMSSLKVNNIKL